MARPLSATDDEILEAAQQVIARRGPDGFSISEVAREVGLSRAAITLRFKGDELKRVLMNRYVDVFDANLQALNIERGSAGLLAIAEQIATNAASQGRFSSFMLQYSANIQDAIALEMERKRGQILRAAIAKAMPETAIELEAAVDAFMAHITGSLLYWQTSDAPDARRFLRDRTLNWLRLAGIAVDEGQA